MFKIFLPLIIVSAQLFGGIFRFSYGAQIEGPVVEWSRAPWIVPGHIYQIHIKLDECDNGIQFNCPTHYDEDIAVMEGNDIIVNVKVVPKQFRLYPDNPGSPPKFEYCYRVGEFLYYLKTKYPTITAFDLFNEPDVPLELGMENGEFWGAWVIDGDYYSSGRYYGQCVEAISTTAKILNPSIKTMAGALIGAETSFDFLRGMVEESDSFDMVSFHKYLKIGDSYDIPLLYAQRLRQYTYKPLAMTETSVLAGEDSEELQAEQAQYLSFLINNASYSDISIWLWYSLANNGWLNSDLVYNDVAKPAYYVYANYPGVGGGGEEYPRPGYEIIIILILIFIILTIIYEYRKEKQ